MHSGFGFSRLLQFPRVRSRMGWICLGAVAKTGLTGFWTRSGSPLTMSSVREFQLSTTRFEKVFARIFKQDHFLKSFNECPRVAVYLLRVNSYSLSILSMPCIILYTWIISVLSLLILKMVIPVLLTFQGMLDVVYISPVLFFNQKLVFLKHGRPDFGGVLQVRSYDRLVQV